MINAATAAGNPVHTELETEFDRVLLTKDGFVPPERQYLGQRLKLTWGESVTVAGFYPPATVYTVRRSVRLMAAVSRPDDHEEPEAFAAYFQSGRRVWQQNGHAAAAKPPGALR